MKSQTFLSLQESLQALLDIFWLPGTTEAQQEDFVVDGATGLQLIEKPDPLLIGGGGKLELVGCHRGGVASTVEPTRQVADIKGTTTPLVSVKISLLGVWISRGVVSAWRSSGGVIL
jgi:hypothetical protein